MWPPESEWFTASYDTTTRITTAVVCALLAVVAVTTQNAIVAGVGVFTIALTFAYSPRAYRISSRAIVVKRLIGNARIPLDALREVRRATADDLRGSIRLWASGGVFGYHGLFRTSALGRCWWYVTNRRNIVVVITDSKTTLFSPDDIDGFMAALPASVQVPEYPQGQLPIDSRRGSRVGIVVGVAITAVVVAVIALAFGYSPGPPRYTLTSTSLTIHDRFYPVTISAADMDVDQIRVVDIGKGSEWRPTSRTNGFANAHYHSGWFRVANGQKVRMYWASGRHLVLLPPKDQGNAVLVEVNEPEEFVTRVREEWMRRSRPLSGVAEKQPGMPGTQGK